MGSRNPVKYPALKAKIYVTSMSTRLSSLPMVLRKNLRPMGTSGDIEAAADDEF